MAYLIKEDVALIKGMLKRGDKQSDIAAWFGTNGGRISEINTEQKWKEVKAAPEKDLPPPGPYMAHRSAYKAKQTLTALRDLVDQTLAEIANWEINE